MRTRTTYSPTITRSKGPFVQDRFSYPANVHLSGPTSLNPGGSVTMGEGEETIIDDPTPSHRSKPVTHYKRSLSRVQIDSYDEHTSSDRYTMVGPGAHWHSWGEYGKILLSDITANYPTTVAQLKAQAMHRFHDTNQVDNLTNAVEIRQTVSAMRQLGDTVHTIRQWSSVRAIAAVLGSSSPSNVRKARSLIKRHLKDAPLGVSNLFLAWSFGFAPLISDVKHVIKSIPSLRESMDRAVRDAGKPFTVTAKSYGTLSLNAGLTGWGLQGQPLNNTFWHESFLTTHVPTRLVGVRGVRTVKYSMPSFNKLSYLINRFVSAGPASFIWEHVKYSFVVDWFVDLSGVIDACDNALTGGTHHINDIWTSEKWTTIARAIKHQTISWSSDSDGVPTVANVLSYYHREPLDHNISIVPSGRFGKKQFALASALIHQLVANLKG